MGFFLNRTGLLVVFSPSLLEYSPVFYEYQRKILHVEQGNHSTLVFVKTGNAISSMCYNIYSTIKIY